MPSNIDPDCKSKLALALDALRRAERDLVTICTDDRGKVDPAFTLDRIRAALKNLGA